MDLGTLFASCKWKGPAEKSDRLVVQNHKRFAAKFQTGTRSFNIFDWLKPSLALPSHLTSKGEFTRAHTLIMSLVQRCLSSATLLHRVSTYGQDEYSTVHYS